MNIPPPLAALPMFFCRFFSPFALVLLSAFAQVLLANEKPEDFTILAREDHDTAAFTQGFALDENWFYESSGHYGRSFLLRYEKDGSNSGRIRLDLPRDIFAEGLEVVGERLFLLSWRAGRGWVYDKNSFTLESEFRYHGEGWGLTYDGEQLVMSDGSDMLRFYDEDFQLLGSIAVRHEGRPLRNLNELEYHDGMIWANQWHSNFIYAIDPASGEVKRRVDLSELQEASASPSPESVANGIAYDAGHDAFWITGKYWKHRYLLRFTPDSATP